MHLASYDRALAIKPDYVEALNNRGVVLEVLLRHDEALACFDRAVALDPDQANALTNRGHTLLDLTRYDEAIRDFERVLVMKPQTPWRSCCTRECNVAIGGCMPTHPRS